MIDLPERTPMRRARVRSDHFQQGSRRLLRGRASSCKLDGDGLAFVRRGGKCAAGAEAGHLFRTRRCRVKPRGRGFSTSARSRRSCSEARAVFSPRCRAGMSLLQSCRSPRRRARLRGRTQVVASARKGRARRRAIAECWANFRRRRRVARAEGSEMDKPDSESPSRRHSLGAHTKPRWRVDPLWVVR